MARPKPKRERKSKFKRGKRDKGMHKRRRKQRSSGATGGYINIPDGVDLLKIDKTCTRRFNVIPFIASEDHPRVIRGEMEDGTEDINVEFSIYRSLGPANRSFIAPGATYNAADPVKDYRNRLEDGEEKKQLGAKSRQLWLLHDCDDGNVYLFESSYYNFGKILDELLEEIEEEDPDDARLEYFDPEDGYTIKVRFAEESFDGNVYYPAKRIEIIDRKVDVTEDVYEKSFPLESCLVRPSVKQLNDCLFDEGAAEETEDEAPAKRKSKRVDDDDDIDSELEDDFDDDDDDDDDEPAPKPKKKNKGKGKSKSKKSPPPEDDDDDDDDFFDDDDDDDWD